MSIKGLLGFALRKARGRTVRTRGSNATCARGAMPKKEADPICQLVALTPEQMWNLHGLHEQKYEGKEVVSCPGCLKAQEAVINGDPSDCERLRVARGEHNNSPTTCLQKFWLLQLRLKKMCKNGNLGRNAQLTEAEVKMAEKALSRANTAPGTPGTPTYDPSLHAADGQDDEVPDTQEGGSSSEVASEPKVASVPQKKGRGRPKGVKNKTSYKERVRIKQKSGRMKLVAKGPIQSIAVISDAQIKLFFFDQCVFDECVYGLSWY